MLVPFPEGGGDQLPTFDVESKNAEIPKSQFQGKEVVDQLPTFDADFNNAKIPKSHFLGGGWLGDQLPTFDPKTWKLSHF